MAISAVQTVVQTLEAKVQTLRAQLLAAIDSGELNAQDDLHAIVEDIQSHLAAIGLLKAHVVAQVQADAAAVKGQATAIGDAVAADVQKAKL